MCTVSLCDLQEEHRTAGGSRVPKGAGWPEVGGLPGTESPGPHAAAGVA